MPKFVYMRGFLASSSGALPSTLRSLGAACAAVLALTPAPPAFASGSVPASGGAVPGSTRSLPLVPLSREGDPGAAPEQGLRRTGLGRFALLGVVWDDPGTELRGRVRVRTRSAVTGEWTGWQDVEAHADHGADPGTAERSARRVRGATAPLWVGASDGVDVRVRAERTSSRSALPSGLRLELVDPGQGAGEAPAAGAPVDEPPRTALDTEAAIAASGANADIAAYGTTEIPELDRPATELELTKLQSPSRGKQYIGPRPKIVTRRGWGADESLRERGFVYTKKIKAAFVHHTASGNNYTCAQAPSVIRGIYRYHVKSLGWRDIGYNFLVDKCGKLYEGRAGGVAKAVLGAHTLGFNTDSMGVAVIGSHGTTQPPGAAVTTVARLAAWKLGLHGADPRAKTYLTSGGGNLYPKGKKVRLNVMSGHRDGYATECPGKRLYAKLGTVRTSAARYQGR
ncbi:peptidoglycan recognition protein [Streptomyces sp. CSDS2]|uniref:peptidoglycan recognition protein family protein n=1 Tax=Streptomyces sp. CSDS2 TaxID=3055051 RepID=UPI0025B20C26|nr:peptidoglycan recognition protein [Streptomyces sp. CSDS2]MDN3265025.1 peptidoglycan recognition protein [Streptomyces sp. CSDS2]